VVTFALVRPIPQPDHPRTAWSHCRAAAGANRNQDSEGLPLSDGQRAELKPLPLAVYLAKQLTCPFDNSAKGEAVTYSAHSPTQRKVVIFQIIKPETTGAKEMSRISFMLLIVTGLALTVYFGTAAWRLTDDSHLDITGQILR
jgi:hypothetical protein